MGDKTAEQIIENLEFSRFEDRFSDEKLLKKWQNDLLNSKAD
jgi:hypothetical protein